MQKYMLIWLFVIFGFVAAAKAEQIDEDKLSEKYLLVTKQKQMNEKMIQMLQFQMSQNIDRVIRERNLTGAQRDLVKRYASEMSAILIDEIKWEKIKLSYIEAVEEVYTDLELQKLIEFFQTDLGKLYIDKDQSMKMKIGEVSQTYVKNAMIRIRQIETNMRSELEMD